MHDHIYKPRSVPAPRHSRRSKYISTYLTEDDYLKVKEVACNKSVSEYLRILIRDDIYKHYGTFSEERI